MKKICLTGGIACGKSLLCKYLNELGVHTLDADDIAHELISEEERERLRKTVFKDPAARKALETRLHPLIKARLNAEPNKVHVIPLLFEVDWEKEYDIICAVVSNRENQIERMMANRGYSREDAEVRLRAQLPNADKARKSQYVINNNGSVDELRKEAKKLVSWLKSSMCLPIQ